MALAMGRSQTCAAYATTTGLGILYPRSAYEAHRFISSAELTCASSICIV